VGFENSWRENWGDGKEEDTVNKGVSLTWIELQAHKIILCPSQHFASHEVNSSSSGARFLRREKSPCLVSCWLRPSSSKSQRSKTRRNSRLSGYEFGGRLDEGKSIVEKNTLGFIYQNQGCTTTGTWDTLNEDTLRQTYIISPATPLILTFSRFHYPFFCSGKSEHDSLVNFLHIFYCRTTIWYYMYT